ncbi:MAG: efflux RND transporter periplasmic adaptor subunit [Acidobacteria bacterium]|nr:efflux RND transporter periplasmic adaptor subunit [Acidobacteriota bacterium]
MSRVALYAALAASLVACGASCGGKEPQAAPTETQTPESIARTPSSVRDERPRVDVSLVEPQEFSDRLIVTATIEAWDDVDVGTEIGGFVRDVLFDEGEIVDKGAVLARIGDDLAGAQLDQAKADLMAAEANFTKISKLFERQSVPQQDLVAATSRRDNALAVVREMEIRLDRAVIRAPLRSAVSDRLVEPGEIAAPGALVARLQRVDRLKAVAALSDTEVAWITRGREARLTVDAYRDQTFTARVHLIAPSADAETRTFDVEFALDNAGGALRPGMVGRIDLVRRRVEGAIVVRLDAIVTRQKGPVVFVVATVRRARTRRGSSTGSKAPARASSKALGRVTASSSRVSAI